MAALNAPVSDAAPNTFSEPVNGAVVVVGAGVVVDEPAFDDLGELDEQADAAVARAAAVTVARIRAR